MNRNSFPRVGAAGRIKTARPGKQGGKHPLIDIKQAKENGLSHGPYPSSLAFSPSLLSMRWKRAVNFPVKGSSRWALAFPWAKTTTSTGRGKWWRRKASLHARRTRLRSTARLRWRFASTKPRREGPGCGRKRTSSKTPAPRCLKSGDAKTASNSALSRSRCARGNA